MLLEINFTLVLFAVSFLIFIYLLNLTLYKPVGKIIEARKSFIDGDYTKAKGSTESANNLLEDYKKEIKQARQEAQNIINETIAKEQKVKEENISRLLDTLNKEKDQALKQIRLEKEEAMKKLQSQIKSLVDLITNKVLGRGEKSLAGTH